MSAFNQMVENIRDRNWGGTNASIACEPYVSGYSFIMWTLPDPLGSMLNQVINRTPLAAPMMRNDPTYIGTPEANQNRYDAAHTLEHAMNSVTPPGGTINKVEIQGIGGSKWAVPGGMDYQNSISIKYLEFSGLPIHKIHRAWCNMIRDNHSGNTILTGATQPQAVIGVSPYNKSSYSGTLLYWTTKPDGLTVEFAAAYSGLFPTKDPMDLFSGDITSIDKLEIEIEYNVDMIYNEDWVYDKAQQMASQHYAAEKNTRHFSSGFRNDNGISTTAGWSRDGQSEKM